ncbi:hypothetical protein J7M23_02275 [Candidatus Sumerlaeota bacterium]|nr:hypothetical protein [Candidatus Sumerlaeota bacterium]
MFSSEALGIWIGAGLTLCIYSFLYKDNPFYKFAEHIYVGVSTGYLVCTAYFNAIKPYVLPLSADYNEVMIIPTILGILLYTRFFGKISWISRYTLAFIIGAGAGISAPNVIQALIIRQVGNTITPFYNPALGAGISAINFDAIVVFIVVVCVMVYFFFSVEHKGVLAPTARLGIIFLMIYFGAAFGYTVMGRVSLAIGRIRFLIIDWIGLILQWLGFGGF